MHVRASKAPYHRMRFNHDFQSNVQGICSTDAAADTAWWRYQMETFSGSLANCEGQWRGALIFSLISACINGWVNNRKAGDLRRHLTHYDVTVMGVWTVFFREGNSERCK